MLINISLIILGGCLLILIVIAVRKFPNLAAIDVKSIPEEQQAEKKEQILTSRFKGLLGKIKSWGKELFGPTSDILRESFWRLHNKLLDLEKRYKKSSMVTAENGENIEQKITHLLREAEELIKEKKFMEAEQKYITIISLDIKNTEAYEGLVGIYIEGKEYEQALQTLDYLIKINPQNFVYYIELGEIFKILGDKEKLLANAKLAVKSSPHNPRTLDFLLESAIIGENKKLAEDTLKKLEEVNPENEKLSEFKERIKEIK
ncbi:MAG: hypothetical protein PHD51_01880 [Patescibacteria group bacterium]|nr:hypothetical protein [Patescibacteria group bacterium]MDD5490391.1 hypothetical protein [Patescibacteria group bacterium]